MKFKSHGGLTRMGLALCLAVLSGCGRGKPSSGYGRGPMDIKARILAEFTARRTDGDGREFKTVTEAWIRLRRTDSMSMGFRIHLEVDSIRYASSERDQGESAFMRELLKRYRADWKVDPKGRASDMREDPELPRGDLTFRLGPGLAAVLPVLSASPAETQSLFDPSDPGAVLIQENSDHGSKSCELKFSRTGGMDGKLKFTMDEKLGFPSSIELDVKGELPSGGDPAAIAQPAGMRFRYAFKVTEPPSSP